MLNVVRGIGVCGLDHASVGVKDEFIFEVVSQGVLEEGHVSLQWDVEVVAVCIGNCLVSCNRRIPVASTNSDPRMYFAGSVDALVLVVFPLLCCFSEIVVALVDVAVIYRH